MAGSGIPRCASSMNSRLLRNGGPFVLDEEQSVEYCSASQTADFSQSSQSTSIPPWGSQSDLLPSQCSSQSWSQPDASQFSSQLAAAAPAGADNAVSFRTFATSEVDAAMKRRSRRLSVPAQGTASRAMQALAHSRMLTDSGAPRSSNDAGTVAKRRLAPCPMELDKQQELCETPSQLPRKPDEESQDSLASLSRSTSNMVLSQALPPRMLRHESSAGHSWQLASPRAALPGPAAQLPLRGNSAAPTTPPRSRSRPGLRAGPQTPRRRAEVVGSLTDGGGAGAGDAWVLGTPEPKTNFGPFTPPPAPCFHRERRQVERDLDSALDEMSGPSVFMTLQHAHSLVFHGCCGDHALHEAINRRHLRAFAFLIEQKKHNIEERCCGASPLLHAVQASAFHSEDCGHRMAQLLLQRGALPDAAGENGDSALHTAASRGCTELAALLLAHGADPNRHGAGGETALHHACRQHRHSRGLSWGGFNGSELIQTLLNFEADPQLCNAFGIKAVDLLQGPHCDDARDLLERSERWQRKRSAILARALGQGGALVCRLPDLLFRIVVQFM
eukprot:TRINITY_DN35321_c0_g1_i1.p1 TRINITY_DN35321_c0_g1~~TRINITY_DN35321_c0_g1_i1.p1  ORF type:complete len:559 (-),score=73.25 TRINITY_DN35321_c0_g1_i1:201-1877(-)